MENNTYQVLLYYKYVLIDEPELFAQTHLAACKEIGLLGRILVSTEGINGTVSGTLDQTQAYMDMMKSDERFADMMWKIDASEGHAFKKMHVRAKNEVVHLGLGEDDINPNEITGEYLSPTEFYEKMQQDDTIVIDARNDYEFDLGHFRGAVRPEIKNFRDLPAWMRENKEQFEGKKILTYCTGGIRCEKFSGWLVKEGYEDVGQLHGGIHAYGTDPEVKGQLWDGQMYVFDERIAVPINKVEHVIVGKDHFDGTPCERYVNCANPECNDKILCSEENEHLYLRSCSDECRTHPRNRYIVEHGLTEEQFQARLEELERQKQNI